MGEGKEEGMRQGGKPYNLRTCRTRNYLYTVPTLLLTKIQEYFP